MAATAFDTPDAARSLKAAGIEAGRPDERVFGGLRGESIARRLRADQSNCLNTSVPFVPPKPKELDNAIFTSRSSATFGV